MKRSAKAFAIGAIALSMAACSSQKDQAGSEAKTATTQQGGRGQGGPPSYDQLLSEMDTNKDGKLSKSEAKGPLQEMFSKIDTDADGFISKLEFDKAPKPEQGQRPQR